MKISDIQKIVCEAYEITIEEMLSRSRRQKWAHPRMVAMALAREDGKRLAEIARAFKRDHSTIVHAIKKSKEFKDKEIETVRGKMI